MTLPKRLKEMKGLCDAATEGDKEKWCTIPHARHYQVSNMGRIRSLLKPGNHKEKLGKDYRILKQASKKSGHMTVSLKNDYLDKYETESVHRLVAHAFVEGKRFPGYHVAHLDGNPKNNKASNLVICSAKENNSHKKSHGTNGEGVKNSMSFLQEWQVEEIKFLCSKSLSRGKIARLFDISPKLVDEIANGKTWSHVYDRTAMPQLIEALEVAVNCIKACEHYHPNPANRANLKVIEQILSGGGEE